MMSMNFATQRTNEHKEPHTHGKQSLDNVVYIQNVYINK